MIISMMMINMDLVEAVASLLNLLLVVLLIVIVVVKKVRVCIGRNRARKEDSGVVKGIGIRENGGEELVNVLIGKVYKASLYSCFYIVVIQTVVLCFDGVCFVRKYAVGDVSLESLLLSLLLFPVSQCLGWFVLCFLTSSCKGKRLEKLPLLVRFWWICSFVIGLIRLYFDGKVFAYDGFESLKDSRVLGNILATPALGFLCFAGLRGITGIYVIRGSDLHEPLLVDEDEEDAGCLKVTPYSDAGLFSLATLSWLNGILSIGVKRPLELSDIPLLAPEDRSKFNYKILNTNWERFKSENQASLAWALARSYWKEAAKNAVFAGLYTLVSYAGAEPCVTFTYRFQV